MLELLGKTVSEQSVGVYQLVQSQLKPSELGTFATAGYADAPGSAVVKTEAQ